MTQIAMFDNAADTYDEDFTYSIIGKLQRNQVWKYLDETNDSKIQLNILELNCGTGEDAIRFALKGHSVIATDQSEEMLKITEKKIRKHKLESQIQTSVCDLKSMDNYKFDQSFDLIFSNFGGLNCLNTDELSKLSSQLSSLLKPHGRFISVVMPRICFFETLYFLLKLEFKKAFRRNTTKSLTVKVGDSFIETWYYSPPSFYDLFKGSFTKRKIRPIGIAIPPSYMEKTLAKKNNLMKFLSFMENHLASFSVLGNISDHFLLDMQKKEE